MKNPTDLSIADVELDVSENAETLNYLRRRFEEYQKANPKNTSNTGKLYFELFGVNGESLKVTRQTILNLNILSVLRGEDSKSTVDYLFDNLGKERGTTVDSLVAILRSTPSLENFLTNSPTFSRYN